MTDKLDAARRSSNMSAIRSTHTGPEKTVRRLVYALGHRYRLHGKHLPGKPDLVFGPRRKAIFVHGCFWHQHQGCADGRLPQSNSGYWHPKLTRNVARDAEHLAALRAAGWKTLIVWECETKDVRRLAARIKRFLGG